jgi:hypothetical protein
MENIPFPRASWTAVHMRKRLPFACTLLPACIMELIIVKWELTATFQVHTLLNVWKSQPQKQTVLEQAKVVARRTLTAAIQRLLVNLVSVLLVQQLVHTLATAMNLKMLYSHQLVRRY